MYSELAFIKCYFCVFVFLLSCYKLHHVQNMFMFAFATLQARFVSCLTEVFLHWFPTTCKHCQLRSTEALASRVYTASIRLTASRFCFVAYKLKDTSMAEDMRIRRILRRKGGGEKEQERNNPIRSDLFFTVKSVVLVFVFVWNKLLYA